MTPFCWFVIAHLVGDFLLQTEFEAMNKANGSFWNRALFAHVLKYTLCFVPAFVGLHMSLLWLAPIFLSHLILDRRWPVLWWRRVVARGSEASIKNTFWLTIVVDQIFHVLVLAAILAAAS